jgi:predicted nucleic acid-binding protein
MYFLGDIAGWSGQEALWRFFDRDVLQIHFADRREIARARTLMEKYADTPMDLADASLVAAAETLKLRAIFTLDSDFHVYRIDGVTTFQVVP